MRNLSFLLGSLIFSFTLQPACGQTRHGSSSSKTAGSGAQNAARLADVPAAIRAYRLALASDPQSASLHAGLSSALAAQGDLQSALDEERIALRLKPADTSIRRGLALLLYRSGDLRGARSELEPLLAKDPKDLPSALILSDVHIGLHRDDEAVNLLLPFESAHPGNIELEYSLGFAMIQTGRASDGASRMEKVAGARKLADAWMIAGLARFAAGQFHPAQTDADHALSLNRQVRGGYTLLGKSIYVLGQHQAAAGPLENALRADPMDFDANLYLAIIRLENKQYRSAESLLDLAISLRPDYPLALIERAKLLGATGRALQATAILEGLVKGKPDWQEAHWELANDYFKLGRMADGQRERAVVQQLRAAQSR